MKQINKTEIKERAYFIQTWIEHLLKQETDESIDESIEVINFNLMLLKNLLSPVGTRKEVVTICGSMRFYQDMLKIAGELTLAGVIVLMPFVTGASGNVKVNLDILHQRKIDLSDSVLIVDGGFYIGESTAKEISYALMNKKVVRYASRINIAKEYQYV